MFTRRYVFASLMVSVLPACGGGHDMGEMGDEGGTEADAMMVPEVFAVPASAGPVDRVPAPDLDPSPTVVEVAIEAKVADIEVAPGRSLSMWTYDGQLPGPRIEARVGDTVRVRFRNSLPEATTIHWHGVRVPAAMDGVPAVQSPVAPGAALTYEFVVPDAGTFWYHPHVRSDEQVERGLYGAIIVHGDEVPATTSDRIVMLDDLLIDGDWQPIAFSATQAMAGRQGNLIIANGWAHPIVRVARGGLHRFRFVNAANARYFRLALPGRKLIQIGTDGGLLAAPREVDDLLLVPGERAEVLVVATGEAGEAIEWRSLAYDRGHGTGTLPDATIFEMRNDEGAPIDTPPLPSSFAAIAELPAATVRRELRLEESMAMAGGEHGGHGSSSSGMDPVFSINGQVYPDGPILEAALGAIEEWSVVNTTEMDHPFHLHGFRFQILAVDGQVPGFSAWRDSINVPARQTVKLVVPLEAHPGTWMFHCHILEHAERGMMGELRVAGP